MPLKVITAKKETLSIHTPADFEQFFGVAYLPGLRFDTEKTQERLKSLAAKASRKDWISARQKWLGHYYGQSLQHEVHLDLTIAWIDEKIGYGVWTNVDLPAHAYIGEYAGILRKRRFFGRWKNRYCFDYNVGEGRESGYVIDAQDAGNHTRFINHSFRPNVEPASIYCDGLFHVILYAPRAIPAGSQLSYDYGEDYWKKRSGPLPLIAR